MQTAQFEGKAFNILARFNNFLIGITGMLKVIVNAFGAIRIRREFKIEMQ